MFLKLQQRTGRVYVERSRRPRLVASYKLTLGASFISALVNAFFGLLVAWVLARYDFPGKELSMPSSIFRLPCPRPLPVSLSLRSILQMDGSAVTSKCLDFRVAYTPLGVMIALMFVGLPFVVRNVQPVLEDLIPKLRKRPEVLERHGGRHFAGHCATLLLPSLLTGFSLAFARALGEYGSVVFISGNRVFETEITSFMIMNKLDQYDVPGADCDCNRHADCFLRNSSGINLLQARSRRYMETS